MIKAPPVIIALLKTLPDASPDEMPKKIKNVAKTMAMSESAFIFDINFVVLFFNRKNSRCSRRH